MEKKKFTTQEKGILFIAVIALTIVILGVSYSYFSVRVIGNEDATETDVITGKFDIDFNGSEYFNNPQMLLIKDEDRATNAEKIKFTVKNIDSSNLDAEYYVSIVDIAISDNFKSADFKWELLKDNTVIATGDFEDVTDEIQLNTTAITIAPSITDTFTLRAWLSDDENKDQSSLMNGTFKGKVSISATAA